MVKAKVKYVKFEKFKDTNDPSKCIPEVFHEIHTHFSDYVGHSTRAYQVDNNIHFATEVIMNLPEALQEDNTSTDYEQILQKYGLTKLGRNPKFKNYEPRVAYVIYDTRQLHIEYQKRYLQSDNATELKGDALLVLEKRFYKFKDIRYPMTWALYGAEGDVPGDFEFSKEVKVSSVSEFKQVSGFRQEGHGRIVLPEMKLEDFLSLRLRIQIHAVENIELPLLHTKFVKVELLELIQSEAKGFILPGLLRREVLYEFRSLKKSDDSYSGRERVKAKLVKGCSYSPSCSLAHLLGGCKLPKMGPTIFASGFSRCYGIKVTVEWDFGGSVGCEKLSAFSEIYVATKQFAYVKRDIPPSFHYLEPHPVCLTVIEKSEGLVQPPEHALRRQLQNLPRSSLVKYIAHQTDCFKIDQTIFAVSKVDGAKLPKWKEESDADFLQLLDECGVTVIGGGPCFRKEECFIICEVAKSSSIRGELEAPDALKGGLFLETNGCRQRYTFPFYSPISFFSGSTNRFSLPLANVNWESHIDLTLESRFKMPDGFKQEQGAKIVLPGMALREFLSLEFAFPISYDKLRREGLAKYDYEITIREVRVSLVEIIRSNNHHLMRQFTRDRSLVTNKPMRSFRWSDCKAVSDQGVVKWMLPIELFDCVLPNMGPTFFSNNMYRGYKLGIVVDVECGAEKSPMRFQVSQKVKIAVTNRKCLPPSAIPPPYS